MSRKKKEKEVVIEKAYHKKPLHFRRCGVVCFPWAGGLYHVLPYYICGVERIEAAG